MTEGPDIQTDTPKIHPTIRRSRTVTTNTGFVWVLTAVGGIVALRATGLSDGFNIGLVVPLLLMLSYAFWGWTQRVKNTEKLADSIYFLGFIWTLVALITALDRGAATDSGSLFRAFGYALWTTGAGMFLRMAIIQMDFTAPEQLEQSRNALAEDIERFRLEVEGTLGALKESRLVFVQLVETWRNSSIEIANLVTEATNHSTDVAGKGLSRIGGSLNELSAEVDGLVQATKETAGTLASVARKVAVSSEKVSGSVAAAADVASSQLLGAARRISEIEIAPGLLAGKVDALAQSLEGPSRIAVEGVMKISESAKAGQENLIRANELTAGSLQSLAAALAGLEAHAKMASESGEKLREQPRVLAEIRGDLKLLEARLKEIRDRQDRAEQTPLRAWSWIRRREP